MITNLSRMGVSLILKFMNIDRNVGSLRMRFREAVPC